MNSKYVVLAADDDSDDRELLAEAFQFYSSNVVMRFVNDGVEVLDYLNGKNKYADRTAFPMPHLLLLDINMPLVNGVEALRLLRQSQTFAALPVTMFSTSSSREQIKECYRAGCNGYLIKPTTSLDMKQLTEKLCAYWFNSYNCIVVD